LQKLSFWGVKAMTLVAKNYGFAGQKLCFCPRNVMFSENKSCF